MFFNIFYNLFTNFLNILDQISRSQIHKLKKVLANGFILDFFFNLDFCMAKHNDLTLLLMLAFLILLYVGLTLLTLLRRGRAPYWRPTPYFSVCDTTRPEAAHLSYFTVCRPPPSPAFMAGKAPYWRPTPYYSICDTSSHFLFYYYFM